MDITINYYLLSIDCFPLSFTEGGPAGFPTTDEDVSISLLEALRQFMKLFPYMTKGQERCKFQAQQRIAKYLLFMPFQMNSFKYQCCSTYMINNLECVRLLFCGFIHVILVLFPISYPAEWGQYICKHIYSSLLTNMRSVIVNMAEKIANLIFYLVC